MSVQKNSAEGVFCLDTCCSYWRWFNWRWLSYGQATNVMSYTTIHLRLLMLDVVSTEINTSITTYFNILESRALLVLFFGKVVLFLGWHMQW